MTDPAAGWQRSDPFELPDWLGRDDLIWSLDGPLTGAQVRGTLRGSTGHELALDVICADVAYPAPVVCELVRRECHLSWHHGEVQLLQDGAGRGLGVPVVSVDADRACEALRRFARAVAVDPVRVRVLITL